MAGAPTLPFAMNPSATSPKAGRPTRIFARLGYLVLVFAAVFNLGALWVTETSYDRVRSLADAVLDAQHRLSAIERVALQLVSAETGVRGYVITGDEAYLAPLRTAQQDLNGEIAGLADRFRNNPVQTSLVESLARLSRQEMAELEATVALRRDQGFGPAQAAMSTHYGKLTMDTLRLTLDGMMREEERVRTTRLDDLRTNQVAIRLGVFAIALLNFLLVTFGAIFMWRELRRQANAATALSQRGAQLEAEVEARTAELRELSHFLERVREQEKGLVARELHDELGGTLTAAKIDLQLMSERLKSDPKTATRLTRVSAALDEAIAVKRRIIEDLRPTLLDNLGIGAALRWQCEQYTKRTGCPCELQLSDGELTLPTEVSIAFYRIAQEALTNITKYAKASKVSVSLARAGDRWHLRVHDDGVGIDLAKQHNPTSHGLTSIRERARALGGEARFSGGPGDGTTVEVWLPAERVAPATSAAPTTS
jgi:signal transduction histidine kinase